MCLLIPLETHNFWPIVFNKCLTKLQSPLLENPGSTTEKCRESWQIWQTEVQDEKHEWSSQRLGNLPLGTNDVMTSYYGVLLWRCICATQTVTISSRGPTNLSSFLFERKKSETIESSGQGQTEVQVELEIGTRTPHEACAMSRMFMLIC